jgi:hypothetical protein
MGSIPISATMGIKTSAELQIALERSLREEKRDTQEAKDAIWDIAIYKLYNYYMNTHIKAGSEEDLKNAEIFDKIKKDHPDLHKEIETIIDYKIESFDSDM